jgi:phosphoribosylanthranilate isomerase
MVYVKICGITRYEDALMAAQSGADMLGFNFYRQSPRYLAPEAAQEICDTLRMELHADCPLLIGLFVNDVVGHISAVMDKVGLDFVQLSGDESDELVTELRGTAYKAIRPINMFQAMDDVNYFRPHFPADERIPSILLDAYHPKLYGGTGEEASAEVALAVKAQVPRMMLAGGLTPKNIAGRVEAIQPWGVDVASGVEVEGQPGVKDAEKVDAFIWAAKNI